MFTHSFIISLLRRRGTYAASCRGILLIKGIGWEVNYSREVAEEISKRSTTLGKVKVIQMICSRNDCFCRKIELQESGSKVCAKCLAVMIPEEEKGGQNTN